MRSERPHLSLTSHVASRIALALALALSAKFAVRTSVRVVSHLLLSLSSLALSSLSLLSFSSPSFLSLSLSLTHTYTHTRSLEAVAFLLSLSQPSCVPWLFSSFSLPLFSLSLALSHTYILQTESLKRFTFLLSILVFFVALSLSQISGEVLRARIHIEEEILQMKCPRCRKAFYDFVGCFAIRHFFSFP